MSILHSMEKELYVSIPKRKNCYTMQDFFKTIFRGVFMKKILWLIVSILLLSGIALWVRNEYRKRLPDLPELLIVGTSADFAPYTFKEEGQILGFDIDLIQEIGSRLNIPTTIQDMPFELLIPQLQHGDIQVVAAGITPTTGRAKLVQFSKSYITKDPLIVLTLAQKPLSMGLESLIEKTVAVNAGYNSDVYMSKIPNIRLSRVPTIIDAIDALKNGTVDAYVTTFSTIQPIFDHYGKDTFGEIFVIEDADEEIALGLSPLYPKLKVAVDKVLAEMQNDGTIEKLKAKWHVQ